MNRTGLIIALAVAVVVGLVFGFYPQLDLRIAKPFHDIVDGSGNRFAWGFQAWLLLVRSAALMIPALLVLPAVAAVLLKLILPWRRMLIPGRAALFLIATLALGPGLLVNVGLKDHWSRPRPIDVTVLGGNEHFVPWWDPRGDCPANCSFVSGDVSGTAWTLAPAALAPPQWRALAYGAALTLTLGMAVMRVVAGGHFFTDAVFAGVFTFLLIWLVHGLIYRWPRTRMADEQVERALARAGSPAYEFLSRLFGAKKKAGPPK